MELTRNISTGLLDSFDTTFYPVVFVRIDWPTGIVRFNSSSKPITALSQTWVPTGRYGSITIPDESMTNGSPTAEIRLSGELDILLDELNQDPRNSAVSIYFSTQTNQDSGVLTGTPTLMFSGYVDGVDFNFSRSEDLAASDISVTVASGPSPRSFASITHSNEDQLRSFPGDTAGEKVVNYNKKNVNPDVWPEN